jgi:uncharacterized membrane protein YvlD (DUF360 family)
MNRPQIPAATEPAQSRSWARVAFALAWLFAIVALGAATVTVAGSYQGVLLTSLGSALLAAVLFAFAFRHGRPVIRIFSARGALPLLFVATEFVRRYRF